MSSLTNFLSSLHCHQSSIYIYIHFLFLLSLCPPLFTTVFIPLIIPHHHFHPYSRQLNSQLISFSHHEPNFFFSFPLIFAYHLSFPFFRPLLISFSYSLTFCCYCPSHRLLTISQPTATNNYTCHQLLYCHLFH
jgi:hypothetical protein